MHDDDLFQRPIVGSQGGGGEISSFSRCAIQGFQEEGAGQVSWRQTTQGCVCVQAKSSVLSELSGLENVLFNDFIDGVLDSEDVSEQRASASLPDSVPIESEEERTAREQDEIDALDAVGGCSTHTHTHKHAQLHTHKEKAIAQWAESLRCTAFVTKVQL